MALCSWTVEVVEWDMDLVGLLIYQHAMALGKGAASNVLSTYANVETCKKIFALEKLSFLIVVLCTLIE